MLGFSLLVFLMVVLRRFFQRASIKSLPFSERAAISAAVYAAAANLLVVIMGAIVISIVQDSLMNEIPLLLKLWLVLPIIATLAGIYLLLRTYGVWKKSLLKGTWARIRFTIVTLCALFMCWFYYYWNILGFQYF